MFSVLATLILAKQNISCPAQGVFEDTGQIQNHEDSIVAVNAWYGDSWRRRGSSDIIKAVSSNFRVCVKKKRQQFSHRRVVIEGHY
jgi:hypothetical protein